MTMPWRKLFDEINHDPKITTLSDRARVIFMGLIPAVRDDGTLAPIRGLSLPRLVNARLQLRGDAKTRKALEDLADRELIVCEGGALLVVNFVERQAVRSTIASETANVSTGSSPEADVDESPEARRRRRKTEWQRKARSRARGEDVSTHASTSPCVDGAVDAEDVHVDGAVDRVRTSRGRGEDQPVDAPSSIRVREIEIQREKEKEKGSLARGHTNAHEGPETPPPSSTARLEPETVPPCREEATASVGEEFAAPSPAPALRIAPGDASPTIRVEQNGANGAWPSATPLPSTPTAAEDRPTPRAMSSPFGGEAWDAAAMRLGKEPAQLQRMIHDLKQDLLTGSDGRIQVEAPGPVVLAFATSVFEAGYTREKMTALAQFVREGELSKVFKGRRTFDLAFFLRGETPGAVLSEFVARAWDWAQDKDLFPEEDAPPPPPPRVEAPRSSGAGVPMPEAMKAHLEGMRRRRLEREANPPPPILGLRLLTREQGEEVDRQVEEIRARKAALRAQREAAEAAAASATGEAGKDPTRAIG